MALTSADQASMLSVTAGQHNAKAALSLAKSAALEERIHTLETGNPSGSGSAAMIWFIVRSLCMEFGIPYATTVERAREWALEQ